MDAINVEKPIGVVNGNDVKPNINICYGPHASISAAITAIKADFSSRSGALSIPAGLTVAVLESETVKEYWINTTGKTGATVVASDLVLKVPENTGGGLKVYSGDTTTDITDLVVMRIY